tara:strand:+ start:38684 stop:40954 length:2271 start_codon:yes stop_codon:yes gene_type:complete
MKRSLKIIIGLGVFGILNLVSFLWLVPLFVPLPEGLAQPNDPSTVITDEDGRPLRRFLVNGEEVISDYASLDEIPEDFINATVAAEDKRFWDHMGIDFFAIFRAIGEAIDAGYPISGASTITQQLVKITDVPRPRGMKAKVIESVTGRKIEMFNSKEWILENYINRLPYGNMRTGCRAAAQGYFGKPLTDLSLAEAALLAALPNKPTRFNPYKNFAGARERQLWILDRMLEDEHIDESRWKRARAEELVLVGGKSTFRAPHAVELMAKLFPDELHPGNVQSTLNLELQQHADQAIDEHLDFIARHRLTSPFLHAAVVVIENSTGSIRVLTGSRDYFDRNGGQINGAWTARSPGSALKPFTYLLALENGFPATTVLADVPTEFPTSTGVYRPVNYDRSYAGPVLIRQALGNSLNIPAVRMLRKLGGPALLQERLKELGLTSLDKEPSEYGLGLTIGSAEVRLLELTNAYACLARLGIAKPYRFFPGEDQPGTRLFDQDACYVLTDILSDNAARAQSFGWSNPLNFPTFRVAAKTGTSSDYRDAWTVGFTPEYTVGVWVGNFDNTPLDHFSGVAGAGPIFHSVMERLHADRPASWYPQPDTLRMVNVDPNTGHKQNDPTKPAVSEFIQTSSWIKEATVFDYDAKGRALLPEHYAPWLEGAPSSVRQKLAITKSSIPDRFEITNPLPGMVIYLDPDLIEGGRVMSLATNSTSLVTWSSPTLEIDQKRALLFLVPGEHQIVAENSETGELHRVHFVVDEI